MMPVLPAAPPTAASAYRNASSNPRRNVIIVVGLVLALFLVRNALTKDYKARSDDYLKGIGRGDLVAKTSKERFKDGETMVLRVQALEEAVAELKSELRELKRTVRRGGRTRSRAPKNESEGGAGKKRGYGFYDGGNDDTEIVSGENDGR
jgi:hypothetical protein